MTATLHPAGITSTEGLSTETLTSILGPSGIASEEQLAEASTATVISVAGIPSGEGLSAAETTLALVVAGIPSSEGLSAPAGTTTLATAGIPSAEQLSALSGTSTLEPAGIATSEALSPPEATTTLAVAGIPTAEALGFIEVAHVITAAGIPSDEGLAAPAATMTIEPAGIPSGESIGEESLSTVSTLAGIPPAEALSPADVMPIIGPAGIPPAEALSPPEATMTLAVAGIPPSEALSPAFVSMMINPAGIPPTEGWSAPTLTATLSIAGIPAGEVVGPLALTLRVTPAGIPSAEALSPPEMAIAATISGFGIPSEEAFSPPRLTVEATLPGIGPDEVFGVPKAPLPPPPPPPRPQPNTGAYEPGDWRARLEWERELRRRRVAELDEIDRQNQVPFPTPRPAEYIETVGAAEVAEIVGNADYVVLPTGEGLQVTALGSGTVYQFVHPSAGPCAILVDDTGIRYCYARMSSFFGETGRRVERGEILGLSGVVPQAAPETRDWRLLETPATLPKQNEWAVPTAGVNAPLAPTAHAPALGPAPAAAPLRSWLIDDRRWQPAPQVAGSEPTAPPPPPPPPSRSFAPAAVLALLAIPVLPLVPLPFLITAIAGALLIALRRGSTSRPIVRALPPAAGPVATSGAPPTIFALNDDNSGTTLLQSANSWLIVTLPPPGEGQAYKFSGEVPPLAPSVASSPIRSREDRASYALPIGSGTGTLTFQLVLATNWNVAVKTYTLIVRAQ